MNFGTAGLNTQDGKMSKYIGYGIQNFKINSWTIKSSTSGNKKVILNVETRPVTTKGFEADSSATNNGQVGRVSFPKFYLSTPEQYQDFQVRVGMIADKLGLRSKVDQVTSDNFEDYVNQVFNIMKDKYAWFKVSGEEYNKGEGKKGISLSLAWYGFVASEAEGESHLKFDKNSTYDFKTVQTSDETALDKATTDDLPF